jgi:signal transduction histidine kinase/DNA-binding response OmpR family regulator
MHVSPFAFSVIDWLKNRHTVATRFRLTILAYFSSVTTIALLSLLVFSCGNINYNSERSKTLALLFLAQGDSVIDNQPEKAMGYYQQVLDLTYHSSDDSLFYQSVTHIGTEIKKSGLENEFLTILKKYTSEINTKTIFVYATLGAMYSNMGETEESLQFEFKRLELSTEYSDELGIARANISISDCYIKLNQFNSARRFLSKALEYASKTNDSLDFAIALHNSAVILEKEKKLDDAIALLDRSKLISKKINDQLGIPYNNIYLGFCYAEKGLLEVAARYYDSAVSHPKFFGVYAEERLEFYYKKSQAESSLGINNKALTSLQNYVLLKDSLMSKEKVKKAQEMKYEEQLQKSKVIQLLVSGVVFLTLITIGFLFNQIRLINNSKKQQAALFREVDTMKSRFFANISHEFRTPLTLLLGPIEKRLSNATDASDKKELSIMQTNASRLLTLVNQLLDLSRLESGSLKLQCRQLNLNELIDRVSSQFASMADSRNITFQIDANEPVGVFADAEKVEKIITNLLSNAFKFTSTNGTIHLIITKKPADKQFPAGSAEIIVRDTGIGIKDDDLPKIFDRFYQVDNSSTRQYEGSGIGLALVKELVELHHGSIVVESIAGEGTCFTIHLPLGKDHLASDELASTPAEELRQGQTAVVADALEEIDGAEAGPSMPKLLVVEDNADLRYYLRSCLSGKYSIMESPDGTDGYQKALEQIPDIVVTDLMMPGMDGIELCKKLKADEKTSHIPIILLTAKADHSTKLLGLRTGADDYITKPFSPDELVTRVENLITIRRNLQQKYSRQLRLMPSEVDIVSMEDRFVKKVMTVIEQYLDDTSFSVDVLASEMAMSNTQLYRKLKSLTGFTPNELIRNTRLERAASLLRQRAGNVADIAYQVGFNNLSYFSKCFKEKFGVSPSEFTVVEQPK